jgi:uncharacterized protein (DUF488 family)
MSSSARPSVYTIGHSTRSREEFIGLLIAHRIQRLVDVRRYPGSRRYPHFGSDALASALPQHGIAYVHEPQLGGRRRPSPDSPNTYWRNDQFRAYADYLSTAEFQEAIGPIVELAERELECLMCAEAVPWRCHRQLIADVLVARGINVLHILSSSRADEHVLNAAATVLPTGGLLYRDPAEQQMRLFSGDSEQSQTG